MKTFGGAHIRRRKTWEQERNRHSPAEDAVMTLFFAKTWFLWWILATVLIVRWFHAVSIGAEAHDADLKLENNQENNHTIHGHAASHA